LLSHILSKFALSKYSMSGISSFFTSSFFPYFFAVLLAIPFIVLLRRFVFEYIKMKNQELKMLSVKGNAENKSQAYERMTLFMERLKPANLVSRFDKGLEKHEFLFLTEKAITEEFDYNASQQLYMTKNSWTQIVQSKNAMLKMLHDTYESLSDEAGLEEFKTIFLMNYMNGEDFIGNTIDMLRREVLLVT